jgi:site-specific DNA recombinase
LNSSDAQYEACAACVAGQRHEGWKLVPDRFDDGGLSGGNLDRPALRRLLAQIDAGRIGMVVVYKIDRLTRSLVDFGRLVERLDARGCFFVSVTQAFNTATSTGRLTLNVLLSFARFEREVTAERIRYKIAASKKKGLWMGGSLPLGHDRHPVPQRRELVVNGAEADVVCQLFAFYGDLGNQRLVEIDAGRLGLRTKSGITPSGHPQPHSAGLPRAEDSGGNPGRAAARGPLGRAAPPRPHPDGLARRGPALRDHVAPICAVPIGIEGSPCAQSSCQS